MPKHTKAKGGRKGRKHGRSKRKALARTGAMSMYVRNKISFEAYMRRTGRK